MLTILELTKRKTQCWELYFDLYVWKPKKKNKNRCLIDSIFVNIIQTVEFREVRHAKITS